MVYNERTARLGRVLLRRNVSAPCVSREVTHPIPKLHVQPVSSSDRTKLFAGNVGQNGLRPSIGAFRYATPDRRRNVGTQKFLLPASVDLSGRKFAVAIPSAVHARWAAGDPAPRIVA